MKNFIRKWLDIPTKEEIYKRIDEKVTSRASKHYAKLRKADRDRYRHLSAPTKTDKTTEV